MLARTLEAHRLPSKVLLNVNYPALTESEAREVRITRLGERKYTDLFETRIDPRGKDYYWLAGEVVEVEEDPDTDVTAIRDNCISVTPIHYDMTCKPMIPEVQGWSIPTTLAGFAATGRQD
ncbi:5'-nucleotidase SurE [compost metagenome]